MQRFPYSASVTQVHAKALQRAAEILGGVDRLRNYLRVSMCELEAWMAGSATPPVTVFLKAVDLISGASMPLPSTSEIIERAKRLRRQSESLRDAIARTRERAARIRAAAMTTQQLLGDRPRSATAAGFIDLAFKPDEGRRMVESALDAALDAAGAEMGNLQLAASDGLRIVAQRGFRRPFLDFFAVVGHASCACGAAAKGRQRVVVPDVRDDPIFAGTAAGEAMEAAGLRAVQSTPLIGQSGELLGMLSTHYEQPRQPTDHELLGVDIVARRATFWLDGGSA